MASTGDRLARPLQVLMWALLAGYAVGLVRHRGGFEPLVDGWLGIGTQVAPTVVSWLAVLRAGRRRREVVVIALAISVFTVANAVFVLSLARGVEQNFPAPADIGFIAFYPLATLAVVLAVRREMRHVSSTVWLDSGLGAIGAGAVLAVVLDQVFNQVTGNDALASGVALIYPLFDMFLAAAVIGIVAVQGRRIQPYWLALLAGLLCFSVVDSLSALSLASDTYEIGGLPDALWSAALVLMSVWATARPAPEHRPDHQVALLVPVLATVAGLGVLVAAARIHESTLAVTLATLTMVAAGARTQLAFRQLRRLADLRRQATTDELTGLPNRRAFYDRAEQQLAGSNARQGLLLLDLDRFKEVNDSLGHVVGDQLLLQIGRRLREQLRDGDLLARLGGDEFAVLLPNTTRDQTIDVARKLRAAVGEPCTLEGIVLRTDVSIGICLIPEQGNDLSVLLRRADIAMYEAKRARDEFRIYAGDDDAAGLGRLRAIQALHTALAEDQMTLHYQPKVDLRTGEVHDVEALVRWNHPTRGLLYPDSFLSLVEDAGLMHALTQFVLAQALDQAAIWHRTGRSITIAVNLSASSLVDTDLPDQICALLAARGLPAAVLQLEITEELLMADRDRTRGILAELRARGIQIAVDDFGTGYSSLAYLRELPIDELKLDRAFVFPMADDARAAALVFSIIDLAHSLRLRLVAEGVENLASLNELARHGCDHAQGYYISRPLPAVELDLWLENGARSTVPTDGPLLTSGPGS